MPNSRREFLKNMTGVAAATATLSAPTLSSGADAAPPVFPSEASYLEINGVVVGMLDSTIGGGMQAQVVPELEQATGIIRKHLAFPKPVPIQMRFGVSMRQEFWDVASRFLNKEIPTFSGAILRVSAVTQGVNALKLTVVQRIAFTDAVMTSFLVDGFSREGDAIGPVEFEARILPAAVSRPPGPFPIAKFVVPVGKPSLTNNFRLTINNIGTQLDSIGQISSFGATQSGFLDLSDLVFTLPEELTADFAAWFQNLATGAQNDERSGRLDALAPNGTKVLYSFTFGNLGIYRINPLSQTGGVPMVELTLYAETLSFRLAPPPA